jgi:hypothetical protein
MVWVRVRVFTATLADAALAPAVGSDGHTCGGDESGCESGSAESVSVERTAAGRGRQAKKEPLSTPERRAVESARWQRDMISKEQAQRILLCGWRVGVAETCFELDQVG